jgi:integrase
MIKSADDIIGNYNVETIDYNKSETLYERLKLDVSIHRAVYTCRILRRIWNKAIRAGYASLNPFAAMGLPQTEKRTVRWSPEQINAAYKEALNMGFPSLGLLILLCFDLGQRPGDMRKLAHHNYNPHNHVFTFVQEKTKTLIQVKASDRLVKLMKYNDMDYIVTYELTDKPYTARQYAHLLQTIRNKLGLPDDLQVRDLRRTGLLELGENGATEDEIRAVSGHKDRQVISTYIPITTTLMEKAMGKRVNREIPG